MIDSDSAGKIPVNVRQKYLDTIVDECLKIFPNNVAAAYERFSPLKIWFLVVYSNLSMYNSRFRIFFRLLVKSTASGVFEDLNV